MADPTNREIATALDELGDLYELDGAVIHRVVAYRNAAKAARDASVSIAALTREGRVTELPAIGATIERKLRDLLDQGDIPQAAALRASYPAGLVEMTRLPGLGPKRARRLYEELGIDTIDGLRAAASEGRIRDLRGFGARAEERILAAARAAETEGPRERVVLDRALAVGEGIVAALRAAGGDAVRVELAGSARRMTDSVKDLDVIAGAPEPRVLVEAFAGLEAIESVQSTGDTGARARTHTGLSVDLRIVAPDQFGNLLQHFTGSKQHNMALREAAVRRGLHVSEYGVLDDATGQAHRCATETQVYERLGLAYIAPELRENRGELEAAARGAQALPELVAVEDLRGDLHCHTTASDGRNSIEEMAHAALARGYEYLAITDHSASHGFGNDVSPERLRRRIEHIRELDRQLEGVALLAGSEVNILPDGRLDYDDALLAELDWTIASVHSSFQISEQAMTDRVVAAMEHPLVDALAHPTGRLIERRAPYPLAMDRVIEAAVRTGTMIEINASPNRRDLDDVHARAAAEAGVPIVIDSDAHGVETLALIRFGVATARRAWLGPAQVANAWPWPRFAAARKRTRSGVRP